MSKFKSQLNKFVIGVMVLVTPMKVATFLAGCSQNNKSVTDPPAVEEVIPPKTEEKPEVVIKTVKVGDLLDENLKSQYEYTNKFNQALVKSVTTSFDKGAVTAIDINEFQIAEEGRIELEIGYVDSITKTEEKDIFEYKGDTRQYSTLPGLSQDKDAYVDSLLASLQLNDNSLIEVDGTTYKLILSDIGQFDAQAEAFGNITFTDVKETTEEKPPVVEMVLVESIVNEIFSGVDFDADLMETAALTVKNSAIVKSEMTRLYAIDLIESSAAIYAEMRLEDDAKTTFCLCALALNSGEKEYFDLAKNFDMSIKTKILELGLTLDSEVEKNSSEYLSIVSECQTLKTNYETKRDSVNDMTSSDVQGVGIATPKQFSPEELEALGITDTNAFAEALLSNTNGTGYEQVTGWTMDDVIKVFPIEFGGEDHITFNSWSRIYVFTKDGVYDYQIKTHRYYGATEDRYGMILNDSENVTIEATTKICDFSENVILYNENGERFIMTTNL